MCCVGLQLCKQKIDKWRSPKHTPLWTEYSVSATLYQAIHWQAKAVSALVIGLSRLYSVLADRMAYDTKLSGTLSSSLAFVAQLRQL